MDKGRLSNVQYREKDPTTEVPQKFYGLPKVHKKEIPFRPIVFSIGSITYNLAKNLAKILSLIIGKGEYHLTNSAVCGSEIRDIKVEIMSQLCHMMQLCYSPVHQ